MPKKEAEELLEEKEMEERNRLFQASRKVLLASVGAVGLAQDEIEDFVNRLVKRGEIAEKDARKLIREVTDKRAKHAGKGAEKQLEKLLDRMNVPTKADIEALGVKINHLSAKVDELKKEKIHA